MMTKLSWTVGNVSTTREKHSIPQVKPMWTKKKEEMWTQAQTQLLTKCHICGSPQEPKPKAAEVVQGQQNKLHIKVSLKSPF